jgi:hypothetical protein
MLLRDLDMLRLHAPETKDKTLDELDIFFGGPEDSIPPQENRVDGRVIVIVL